MDTKLGITLLIVGGYLMAMGIGGVNANSGGARWAHAIVLVIGFVLAGWAVLLPWDGGGRRGAGRPQS
ncbi:MAG: hypothetical protein ACJ786_18490 [Catenulispora sp.]